MISRKITTIYFRLIFTLVLAFSINKCTSGKCPHSPIIKKNKTEEYNSKPDTKSARVNDPEKLCLTKCSKDEVCSPFGFCERDLKCTNDFDCHPNEKCRLQKERICIPKTEGKVCETDDDCSYGEICYGVGASYITPEAYKICQPGGRTYAN